MRVLRVLHVALALVTAELALTLFTALGPLECDAGWRCGGRVGTWDGDPLDASFVLLSVCAAATMALSAGLIARARVQSVAVLLFLGLVVLDVVVVRALLGA